MTVRPDAYSTHELRRALQARQSAEARARYERNNPKRTPAEIQAVRRAMQSRAARHGANAHFGERVPLEDWLSAWYGTCFDCGQAPAEGVDHIRPRSKGGRNVADNLQPACLPCNMRKGAR